MRHPILILSFLLCHLWGRADTNAVTSSAVEAIAPSVASNEVGNVTNAPDAGKQLYHVIPVTKPIDKQQLFIVRRGVRAALAAQADGIILRMDTPGGRVDIMEEIVGQVINLEIPTYTFVEKHAFSAGAIIALATDHVYMSPGSVIGDAMPVIMGSNGYEDVGEANREKMESAMDAIGRTIAQVKGRDENLIRSMIRRTHEWTIEGNGQTNVISKSGEILTLTYQEAAEPRIDTGEPLLSSGTFETLEDMINEVGNGTIEIFEAEQTWADGLADLITTITPLLALLALFCFYAETSSPGIGWFGAAALILFGIIYFGHHVAGLAGMEDLVLIGVGIILLIIEIIAIPGFGALGILGVALILGGLFKSMVERMPGNLDGIDLPTVGTLSNLGPATTTIGVSVIGSAVLFALLLRYIDTNPLAKRGLILATQTSAEEGYQAQPEQHAQLEGAAGTAITDLRPSGAARIDGKTYDVISDGDFIDADSPIVVLQAEGNRILVTRNTETLS